MDPLLLELFKTFGPVVAFGAMMWVMLREQLRAHGERMATKDLQLAEKDKQLLMIVATFETKLTELMAGAAERGRLERAAAKEDLAQILSHCQHEAAIVAATVHKEVEMLRQDYRHLHHLPDE